MRKLKGMVLAIAILSMAAMAAIALIIGLPETGCALKSQETSPTPVMLKKDSWQAGMTEEVGLAGIQPVASAPPTGKQATPDAATKQRIVEGFGKLPLYFIENQGQLDEQVSHYIQGKDKTIYFTKDGLTFVLTPLTASVRPHHRGLLEQAEQVATDAHEQQILRHVVKLEFLNANPDVKPEGKDKTGQSSATSKVRRTSGTQGFPPMGSWSIPTCGTGLTSATQAPAASLNTPFI